MMDNTDLTPDEKDAIAKLFSAILKCCIFMLSVLANTTIIYLWWTPVFEYFAPKLIEEGYIISSPAFKEIFFVVFSYKLLMSHRN